MFDLPTYKNQGRLPAVGQTRCILRRARVVDVAQKRYALIAIFVSERDDCDGPNRVLLTLSDTSETDRADALIQASGSGADFHWRPTFQCMSDCGRSTTTPTRSEQADGFLGRLLETDPLPARTLPRWPEDALEPALPEALSFQPLTDRATYETVRKLDAITLCWKVDETQLHCTAAAPRRRPSQVDLFNVFGFDDFRNANGREALARLSP